tara:strand:- start:494 stop:1090 length:597 start_codon:yes stop_codon:yes gene_type:complete
MRSLAIAVSLLLLAAPVAAHELVIYTVINNDEGPQPAHLPEDALKVGDSVWFWMKNPTENASLVVELSKDGATLRSPTLVFECALDENGSLVDENCKNRFDFTFTSNATIGLWNITYMTSVNGSLFETLYGSVNVNPDVHMDANHTHNGTQTNSVENEGGSEDTMVRDLAVFFAVFSAMGLAILLFSSEKKTDPLEEE